MKILFITNGYPPRHTAGTETYTAGIAGEFARRGHSVQVLAVGDLQTGPHPINGLETQPEGAVTVSRLNLNWTAGPDPNRALYNNPAVAPYLRAHLNDFRPDVVHVTSCYTLSASVLTEVKGLGYPLVLTLTDFWFICPRVILLKGDSSLCNGQTTAWTCLQCLMADLHLYQRSLHLLPESVAWPVLTAISQTPQVSRQRGFRGLALDMADRKSVLPKALALADLVIAPSKFLAGMYQSVGVEKKIQVLEHGHNLDWLPRQRPTPTPGRLVFGYVGRLTPSKGVHIFAQALSLLAPELTTPAQIWGDLQQEPSYVQTLTSATSPDKAIRFCGKFSRAEIANVYAAIDVLVVPSLWYENNPLVIQEAFAAGIPVVASNLGGMAEFVEPEVNGLLFKVGDYQDLAVTLRRFIQEPDLLSRLQSRLPKVKTVSQEADQLLDYYQSIGHPALVDAS